MPNLWLILSSLNILSTPDSRICYLSRAWNFLAFGSYLVIFLSYFLQSSLSLLWCSGPDEEPDEEEEEEEDEDFDYLFCFILT